MDHQERSSLNRGLRPPLILLCRDVLQNLLQCGDSNSYIRTGGLKDRDGGPSGRVKPPNRRTNRNCKNYENYRCDQPNTAVSHEPSTVGSAKCFSDPHLPHAGYPSFCENVERKTNLAMSLRRTSVPSQGFWDLTTAAARKSSLHFVLEIAQQ